MSDIIFYPVALIAALAIVAAAALPGRDRLACSSVSGAGTDYRTIQVSGDDLCRFEASGEAEIELVRSGEQITHLTITASSGSLGDRPDRNPHFRLAADLERVFAGHEVRVTIEARPSLDAGASAFEANYSAGFEGNSGWSLFELRADYAPYSFTWDVPQRTAEEIAVDYLAIRPVIPEKTRSVDVRSVKFELLERTQVAPEAIPQPIPGIAPETPEDSQPETTQTDP
ncbi:MAG: hypothetical protein CMK09_03445 [Ponticaulis sp.]|nr:hypothetical protein [Ponticaulis sp.]|tara:strand:+ start:4004 stop:4687 length:684 start_codon:yes stop_codon:yes gene_type:complete